MLPSQALLLRTQDYQLADFSAARSAPTAPLPWPTFSPALTQRLAARLDEIDPELLAELSPPQQRRLAELRAARAESEAPAAAGAESPWIAWALQLQQGRDLAAAERAVSQAPVTWDITSFQVSEGLSARFADLIGNLNGEAAAVARRSVAALIATFFPPGGTAGPALRPVAAMLFLLLAMDDPLSRADLELLAQLVNHRLTLGLAEADYDKMVERTAAPRGWRG